MEQKTVVKNNKKTDYKWVTAALCFITVFVCLGFCSSNKSIYLSAITEANGLSRGLFSINDSIRFVTTAVVNLFFGRLVMKLGTKKLMLAGVVCLAASSLLYAVASNIFVFYAGGMFLGIGLSWTTTTMVGWVIGKWFKKNKGTVMGAILASNGLGAALATQIVSPIIYGGDTFGYKNAYLLVTGILAALFVLLLVFYREAPADEEAAPTEKPKGAHERSARFYVALIAIFLTGTVLQSVNGVAAAHLKDAGIDPALVASILSAHSLILAGSKFATGFLYDKLGLRATVLLCDISAIGVMAALYFVSPTPQGKIFAFIYPLVSAMALPLETVMLPIFAMDLFDKESYAKNLGLFVSVNTAGYAVGTPLANSVFDLFGTYKPMFAASTGIIVLVACAFIYLTKKKGGRKDV